MEEHQNCPICFGIPEQEIYQCQKGHIVCANCSEKLQECPQCREPYATEKVRNLVLEQILDGLTFDCVHKEEGCNEVLKREDISKHAEICTHGSRLVRICQKIGYDKNCYHELDISNPTLIIKHFEERHGAAVESGNELYIWHTDFASVTTATRASKWSPVLLSLKSEAEADSITTTQALFLVTGRVDADRDCASWSCMQIFHSGEAPSEIYDVEFGIFGKDESSKVLPIKWTIPVTHPDDDPALIHYSRIEIPLWFISSLCLKKEDIPIHVLVRNRSNPELDLKLREDPPEVYSTNSELPPDETEGTPQPGPSSTCPSCSQQPRKRLRGVYLWANI